MLPSEPLELAYYVNEEGDSPFAAWFEALDRVAAERVTRELERLAVGNFSNIKSIGEGVLEYRIDWGPGYRVYFGRDGATMVVLLIGGTKHRQQRDITVAKHLWTDYRRRRIERSGARPAWH